MSIVVVVVLVVAGADAEQPLQPGPRAPDFALYPTAPAPLPTNARLLAFETGLAIVRLTVDGDVPLDVVRDPADPLAPGVVDVGPLTPGEPLRLRVGGCDNCTTAEYEWPVVDAVDDAAPVFDGAARVEIGVYSDAPRRFGIHLCLPLLRDEEPATFRVRSNVSDESRVAFLVDGALPLDGARCLTADGDEVPGHVFNIVADPADLVDEFCFDATASDVAGNVGALSDCVDVDPYEEFRGCGCDASGGAGVVVEGAAVGLSLLGFRRRRRLSAR